MAEAQVPPLTITEERQLEIGCISINNVFAEAQLKKKKSLFQIAFQQVPIQA